MPGTINLGDIVFGLGPDTSRLRTALRDILDFGEAVENAANAATDGASKTEAAFRRQEAAIVRAITQMQNFNNTLRQAGAPADILRSSQNAFKDLNAQMTSGALTPLQYQRAMEQFSTSMSRNQRAFKDWKAEAEGAKTTGLNFTSFLQQMGTAASLVTGPLGGVAFRLTLLSNLLQEGQLHLALWVGAAVLAAQGLVRLGESSLAAEQGLQRMKLQITAISGSSQQAALDMKFVLDVADQFGRPFEDIAQHFARLEMATKGTRLEGGAMRDMFKDIIAYAGKFGLEEERLDGILEQVTRSITRQRLEGQNFRQLENLIPGARRIAAQAMTGGNEAAFDLLLQRGMVVTDKFWKQFWQGMMKEEGIDPTKRLENIFTATGRFKNAQLEMNNAFNQATGLTDAYSANLERLAGLMTFLSQNMATLLKIAGVVGSVLLGGLLGATVVTRFAAITEAVILLGRAMATVATLGLAFTAPLAAIGAIGGAIIAGIGGWVLFNKLISDSKNNLLGATPTLHDYLDTLDKTNQKVSTNTAKLLEKAKAELLDAQATLENLQAQQLKAGGAGKDVTEKGAEETAKGFWSNVLYYLGKIGSAETDVLASTIEGVITATGEKVSGQIDAAEKRIQQLQADILKGTKVFNKQFQDELNQPGQHPAESAFEVRLKIVEREFRELVDESDRTWKAMQAGPKVLADTLEQIQIDKTLEQWRKKFDELRLGTEYTSAKMIELETALKRVRDAVKFDKEFMSLGQTMQFAFGELGKNAIDKFANALATGQLKTLQFKDFVITAIEAIIKKLLELSVLAPLMNALFGANQQAFSLVSGGTGTGGFIGQLLTGLGLQGGGAINQGVTNPGWTAPLSAGAFVQHGGSDSAVLRMVNAAIFAGAPRLHSGLMPDEYPAILQTGERVTPRGGSVGGGGNNVLIKISHPPDTQAKSKSSSSGGVDMHEIIISHVQQGLSAGRLDPIMANRFGARPRPTLR